MNEPEPPKDITPIVKSVGINDSEKILARLCDEVFLKLWAYPNPYGEQGNELCDVLAVFEEHVFIFSIKDILFNTKKPPDVAWDRWKRKAIDESIKQVKGAEKWIRNNPEKIFLDAQCTEKFPLSIDIKNLKIHRIVVAFGAEEACKKYSSDNINGSLAIGYANLKNSKELLNSIPPFILMLPIDEIIHVFDSHNLEIILGELDTVRDFLSYFEAKEEAIKKYEAIHHCGEQDMIAHYLCNFDEDLQKNYIGEKDAEDTALFIDQGLWEDFIKDDSYQRIKEENNISYFWDELLQKWSQHALDKELIGANVFNYKSAMIEMAKESRFLRGELSEAIKGAIENYSANKNKNLQVRYFLLDNYDRAYIFLQTPPLKNEDYEKDYRPRRLTMLHVACGVLKSKFPQLKKVIGIAIEPPRPNQGGSQDFALLDDEDWKTKHAETYLKANKELGFDFFEGGKLRMVKGKASKSLLTQNNNIKTPIKTKPQRNDPCPCGSGKKYKKCCYLKGFNTLTR